MAKTEGGQIDNRPCRDMSTEELLKFANSSYYLLEYRFEALTMIVERLLEKDNNSNP